MFLTVCPTGFASQVDKGPKGYAVFSGEWDVGRNRMLRCQRDDLFAPIPKEWIAADEERRRDFAPWP